MSEILQSIKIICIKRLKLVTIQIDAIEFAQAFENAWSQALDVTLEKKKTSQLGTQFKQCASIHIQWIALAQLEETILAYNCFEINDRDFWAIAKAVFDVSYHKNAFIQCT